MKLLAANNTRVISIMTLLSLAALHRLSASEPLEISGHATTGPGGWDLTVSVRQDTNAVSGFVSVLGGATGPAIQIVAPTDNGCGCWCINARRTDSSPNGTDQRINVYIRDVGDGIASFDQFVLVSGIGIDCGFSIEGVFFQPFRQGDFTASQGMNAAPVATWVQPFDGSVFAEGSSIILTAQATDSDGTVSFVDFYAGARHIGRANGPSPDGIYNFTWVNPPPGHVQVHAVAVDNAGGRGISGSVEIFIGNGNPEPIDLGTVEVSSIGHAFSGFGPGPVPGPIHYSVVDYLIDQDQRSGGGAVLPSVSVNWDTNSQFTLTVSAPAGHKFLVQVPPGQPVGFGGYLFWESTRGGESPFGPVTATFAGLEGTAPEFITADAVLSSSHGYFGFVDLSSTTVSNDFSFTSITLTGTVTPQRTGSGTENYVPHVNSSFHLAHAAANSTDPGPFVSIVPVQSPEAAPSGAIASLAQRISDSTYPTRIKRPLVNALAVCCNSVDRGQCAEAVEMLRAFQRKVAVQLARDPRAARELVNAAQRIIDALSAR